MTQIRTDVYKQQVDDMIGVKVIVYDGPSQIDEIVILNDEDFARIESRLDALSETYVTYEQLDEEIRASLEERNFVEELTSTIDTLINGEFND